ncbi:MAG: recombinase family protein, partial [Acidobacteria bacterium]|nr:recombinase family protein [Acidobacteriota bacterium]
MRFKKDKVCIIHESSVNIGLALLQISNAKIKHENRLCARSTDDQTSVLQLATLKKAGCKTVFKDDDRSSATTKRPALLRCLKKLDRLGRSLRDLITMLDELKQRGVKFRSLTEY